MVKRFDKNDKELCDGDIIDIHQTVNGQSKFVVICVEPLKISYAWNGFEYEYDKESLLAPCIYNGEVDWEIIGNIDTEAKAASLQADDCLAMIGKAPVECTTIEEQQNYYRINMNLVARNKALEDMLKIANKEIESLKRSLYNHVS